MFFLEVDGEVLKKKPMAISVLGYPTGFIFSIESILGSLGEEPRSVILTFATSLFRDSL